MPSASDELTNIMKSYFGDKYLEEGPLTYLKEQGYILNQGWQWSKPGVNTYAAMEQKEFECLKFMIDEWDYGGLVDEQGRTPKT